MKLAPSGIDIFYIDESHDNRIYVVSAVTVPFLRFVDDVWTITWQSHFEAAKEWRRRIRQTHSIPTARELHGVKLASGRGRIKSGEYSFPRPKAGAVYRDVLSQIDFVPPGSILSAATIRGQNLYGSARLEAALYALFQRMRRQCEARRTNGIVFFDEGHPEYRKLYRRAQVYLPTGSRLGAWGGSGTSKNLPLDMFTKDGNEKQSQHCNFTQAADLIAYAAFLKLKSERGTLADWQESYSLGNLYDSIPTRVINRAVSARAPQDGIVRVY